jgi:hypothetical protein
MDELRLFNSREGKRWNWVQRLEAAPPEAYAPDEWKLACRCGIIREAMERNSLPYYAVSYQLLRTNYKLFDCENCEDTEIYRAARAHLSARLKEIAPARERLERLHQRQQAIRELIEASKTRRTPVGHSIANSLIGRHRGLGHVRRQLPVGQGGFHIGGLSSIDPDAQAEWCQASIENQVAAASFIYAYDCGGEPRKYVDREIGKLLTMRSTRRLDLLFLSHFDRDHICGLSRLLHPKTGFIADTIVLPYLDDVERMAAFGRAAAAAPTDPAASLLRDLTVDPVATLERFGPRQIIFIEGGEEEDGRTLVEPIDPPRGGEDLPWALQAARPGLPLLGRPDQSAHATIVSDGDFAVGDGYWPGWRLKPYVKKTSRRAVEDFILCAELLLEWPQGSFRTRMAKRSTRNFVVRRHRTKLAKAYERSFTDKNLTSLCLFSGPSEPERAGAIAITPQLGALEHTKIGWLGTGDAYLRDSASINAFTSHYYAQMRSISSFMLPHHGSIHNSDPASLVSDADNWVVSADPANPRWRHPHPLLRKAAKETGTLRHVTKDEASGFDEAFLVF